MRSPDFDALRSFATFADKLNFTHAASELHISQPALFVKIQELGEILGFPLYRKIGRRLELTEQGKLVARFAREMIGRSAAFMDELQTGSDNSRVVLVAGEGTFLYLLGEPIRDYLKTRSNLKLITSNREGIIDAVQSGKADLGVSSLESVPSDCESRLLYRAEQLLVMPQDHALARKRTLRIADLEAHALIVPPPERPQRQMLSTILQSEGIQWKVAVEAVGWEVTLQFVKLGLGLAVVNSICKIPRGLVARKLTELPQVHYHLFHLRDRANSGPVSHLKEILINSQRRSRN